nr:MAG TPA: Protein of unknown function (DUF1203) [Caudoviricetes sp.]
MLRAFDRGYRHTGATGLRQGSVEALLRHTGHAPEYSYVHLASEPGCTTQAQGLVRRRGL